MAGAPNIAASVAAPKDVSKERILLFSTKPAYYLSLQTTKRGVIKMTSGEFESTQLGAHFHIQFNMHRATHKIDAEGTEYPLTCEDLKIIRKKHLYGTDFAEAVAPDNDPNSSSLYYLKRKKPAQFQGFCREANRRDEETTRIGHIQQWQIEKEVEAVKA